MNSDERQRPIAGNLLNLDISRRRLLKNAFMVGVSAPVIAGLLAACEDDEDDTSDDSADEPVAEAADDDEEDTDTDDEVEDEPVEDDDEGDDGEEEETDSEASTGDRHGGTLRVLEPNDWVNMWPAFTTGPTLPEVYDWLVMYRLDDDDQWAVHPMLAESWEIDETSARFHLREDVEFHDGTPFDAEAVRWNFEQWATHPQSLAIDEIATVDTDNPAEVVDEYTVQLNLAAPDGTLLINLSTQSRPTGIASPTAWEEVDREEEGDSIIMRQAVGTGPFVFEEWVTGSSVTVTRNENYWRIDDDGNQLPYVDGIRYDWVSDDSVRLIEMQAGDADVAEFIRGRDVPTVENDSNLQYVEDELSGGTMHRFFFNGVQGPFSNDLNLRKAVQYAIDREAMAQTVGGGLGEVMGLDTLPGTVGYDESIPYYYYDLDLAREYREASDAPPGLEFRLVVIAREVDEQQSQMMQQMLAEIDLVVNIELVERAAWGDQVRRGNDFDMATQRTSARADNAQLWALTWAPEGAAPYSRSDEPEIWDLILSSREITDEQERHEAYVELQTMMFESAWWGNLWLQPLNFALNNRVQNFPTLWNTFGGLALEEVWLDDND
jgi:peptide/nickel transport system substrate-binding protein